MIASDQVQVLTNSSAAFESCWLSELASAPSAHVRPSVHIPFTTRVKHTSHKSRSCSSLQVRFEAARHE